MDGTDCGQQQQGTDETFEVKIRSLFILLQKVFFVDFRI
jgi:hypothetical protein